MFDMRVINNIQYYYVKESLLHYVALLKTTNASFSLVIVHVGATTCLRDYILLKECPAW